MVSPPATASARKWQLPLGIMLPAIMSLLGAAAGIVGFVTWSASGMDERALARQTSLAHHVIDSQFQRIPHDQESVTIWDDSIYNTKLSFAPEWINANLGIWMREYFDHDDVLVLDDRDQPIYVMDDGLRAGLDRAVAIMPDIQIIVAQLRQRIADGALDGFRSKSSIKPPHVVDIAMVSGVPSLVTVAPIVSDSGAIVQDRGTEYLHVSIVRFDAEFANRLGEQYQITGASFTRDPINDSRHAVIPLSNAAGKIMTFLQWAQAMPGRDALAQTLPATGLAFLIAAIVALVLSYKLWNKSRALEAGRADTEYRMAHDHLTGLANRVTFEAALARVLTQRPSRNRRASILMLDLDRFKQVNDTLGHRAGDALVMAVGQRLGQLMGPADTLARLGGDEFGIIHIHAPGLDGPLDLSRNIIDAVSKPFDIFGSEVFIGVSIGIATAEGGEADPHELARKADIALYEGKATGRNRAVVFEESMNEFLQNRKTIELELREALRRTDQLAVAFQPLYDRDNRLVGAEALARWLHPKLGQVSPAHFIPVAEATGLIDRLGSFVLRAACELGAKFPGLTFAVNISPVQLRDPAFPASIFDLLSETGMRAQDLELEITEGILLEEASEATEALRLFRSAGIRIALDDFGTGYSSLNYLKRYPVDRIKIDRTFVSQLATGSVSVAIVQAMVNLAHALDIEVTAEGVETEEQKRVLDNLGCNVYQGYLLSPPIASAAIQKLLDSPHSRVA